MTPEELAEQQKRIAELAKATRVVEFEIDGKKAQYELFFVHSYTTNGGMMYDLTITYEEQETRHRIILGKEYYEDFDMEPEHVVAMVFTFLLQKKEPRHTEGAMSFISRVPKLVSQQTVHSVYQTSLCSRIAAGCDCLLSFVYTSPWTGSCSGTAMGRHARK